MVQRTFAGMIVASPEFKDPAVQRLAAQSVELLLPLAQNPGLSEDVWFELLPVKGKLNIDLALALVSRKLTPAQQEHVIRTERRVRVLEAMLTRNSATMEPRLQQLLAASRHLTPGLAESWAARKVLDRSVVREVSLKAGKDAQLDWMLSASPEELSDEEAAGFLAEWSSWSPDFQRSDVRLVRLLTIRPVLLERAVRHRSWVVRRAAASCRHLLDECLQLEVTGLPAARGNPYGWAEHQPVVEALLRNPSARRSVVSLLEAELRGVPGLTHLHGRCALFLSSGEEEVTVPWSEAEGPAAKRVISHVLGSWYGSPERMWDLAAVCANPHLQGEEERWVRASLTCALSSERRHRGEVLEAAALFEGLYGPLERFPDPPPPPRPEPYVARWPETWTDEFVSSWLVSDFGRGTMPNRMNEFLTTHLGTDLRAWELVLTVVNDFTGTIGELVELTSLV